jgi:NitT/TauT family transport system substrate-binding protein
MACHLWAPLTLALLATVACAPRSAETSPPAVPAAPAASQPTAPASPGQPAVASLGELRFNYPVANISTLPMHIAALRGYDKEEGFTAVLTPIPGTTGVQAMLAGEFEFSLSVGASLAAAVQGAPVRLVLVQVDKPPYFLYGKASIRSPEDLRDKTIAVDALGGGLEIAARRYLRRNGVDQSLVTFIAMTNTAVPGAIIAGAVDAGVVTPPNNLRVKRAPDTREIAFLGDEAPAVSAGLGTTETLLSARPEVIRAGVRAALKAQDFLVQNREAAIPIMVDYLNLSAEDAYQIYDTFVPHFIKDGRISREVQEQIIRDQVEVLKPERQPPADEVFDLQFAGTIN